MSVELENTDEQLCSIIGRNDHQLHQALGELYRRHARGLLAFLAARVERSDLEDIHQEVWLKVLHGIPLHFTGGSFRGWLFQITKNHIIDRARKKRPQLMGDEVEIVDAARRPQDVLIERERMEILAHCLALLDGAAAELVRARLQGEAYDAICERLKLESARAHSLFHAAKQQLQACVQKGDR